MLDSLLTLLLPAHCLVCREGLRQGATCFYCKPRLITDLQWRCKSCFANLGLFEDSTQICRLCQHYPLAFSSLRFIWDYSAASRDYIRTMKYKPSLRLLSLAAFELALAWPDLYQGQQWDIIVPMPANRNRLKERGLNQADYLAKKLKKHIYELKDCSIASSALISTNKYRKAQADLAATRRIANMQAGFRLNNPKAFENKKILLVDDVVTTGSSLTAAAYSLLEHGANTVDAVTLACSPRFSRQRYELYSSFN